MKRPILFVVLFCVAALLLGVVGNLVAQPPFTPGAGVQPPSGGATAGNLAAFLDATGQILVDAGYNTNQINNLLTNAAFLNAVNAFATNQTITVSGGPKALVIVVQNNDGVEVQANADEAGYQLSANTTELGSWRRDLVDGTIVSVLGGTASRPLYLRYDVRPHGSNVYDFGSTSFPWKIGYFDGLVAGDGVVDLRRSSVYITAATVNSNPVTKEQLDTASVGDEDWWLYNVPSPYITGFLDASNQPSSRAQQTNSFTDVTDDLNVTNWAILPRLETIQGGTWEWDIHYINPSPSGDKDVAPYYVVGFSNLAGGAAVNVATSEVGVVAGASSSHEQIHVTLTETMIDSWPGTGGVIMVQAYVEVTGSGNAPEIDFLTEGDTSARFVFAAAGGNYVSKFGDTMRGDLGGGGYDSTGWGSVSGDTNRYLEFRLTQSDDTTNFCTFTFTGTNVIMQNNISTNRLLFGLPGNT